MGDKGKKDKGKREHQKEGKLSLKERRSQKKDKKKPSPMFSELREKKHKSKKK